MATDMAMDMAMVTAIVTVMVTDIIPKTKRNNYLGGEKSWDSLSENNMQIIEQALNGLCVIKTDVFKDNRGYFLESFHEGKLKQAGIEHNFLQDNFSQSAKNVLRGLHYQNPPFAQGKLVKVISGAVFDIAVDIRPKSPTFGKNFSIQLNQDEHIMLWIPEGFAHGFVSLEDNTIFYYKCTNIYNRQYEAGIRYNDPDLNINWGVSNPILSEKDKLLPEFKNATILF